MKILTVNQSTCITQMLYIINYSCIQSRCDLFCFPALEELILTAIYVKSSDAVAEIDGLVGATADIATALGSSNIAILGDLNADCTYFTKSEKNASLLRGANYYWKIDDDADTTVTLSTMCAYDR